VQQQTAQKLQQRTSFCPSARNEEHKSVRDRVARGCGHGETNVSKFAAPVLSFEPAQSAGQSWGHTRPKALTAHGPSRVVS
jgi:hypothetical protein